MPLGRVTRRIKPSQHAAKITRLPMIQHTSLSDLKRQNYIHLGDKGNNVSKHHNAKPMFAKADEKSRQRKYQKNDRSLKLQR